MIKLHRPLPFQSARELRKVIDQIGRSQGEQYVAFTDEPWTSGPAGGVDLFQAFSDWRGKSIRLAESIVATRPGVLALYLVPTVNVSPFLAFITAAFVRMPEGSIVAPVAYRPGDARAYSHWQPRLRWMVPALHLISFEHLAADVTTRNLSIGAGAN